MAGGRRRRSVHSLNRHRRKGETGSKFEGDNRQGWPRDETRIIAINEGRLVDFLTEHEGRYARLRTIVLAGPAGAAPEDGVAAVNLNQRSVVASPPASVGADSIFDRLLRRLTTEKYREACAACELRDQPWRGTDRSPASWRCTGPARARRRARYGTELPALSQRTLQAGSPRAPASWSMFRRRCAWSTPRPVGSFPS